MQKGTWSAVLSSYTWQNCPSAGVRQPQSEAICTYAVTSQRYTEMISEFLSRNLPPNSGTLWFQEDGATAHTAVISVATFRRLFPQRVISRFGEVLWPPRSPDLTAPDFFLWGYLKSDRLCGLVVRVSGYRYRGLGFDSRRYQIF